MLRLLSHCPMYAIFCCRKRADREEDQQTIADQLEVQQQHQQHHQQQSQGHENQTESHTVAIIMPKQQHEMPQAAPKRVGWTADRMLKRHTRRRASHSPAQLKEMCINVEVHHCPEAETETETEAEAEPAAKISGYLGKELELDKPIAEGVEIFPSDTVAILHLATNETEADTDTGKHHQHPHHHPHHHHPHRPHHPHHHHQQTLM